jgi:hypothetical protein
MLSLLFIAVLICNVCLSNHQLNIVSAQFNSSISSTSSFLLTPSASSTSFCPFSSSQITNTTTCRAARVNNTICAPFVTWPVVETLNDSAAIQYVETNLGAQCIFFERIQYQCYKAFPLCNSTTITSSTSNTTITESISLCRSFCISSQQYCLNYNTKYFTDECLDTCFYTNNTSSTANATALCRSPIELLQFTPFIPTTTSAASDRTWAFIVGGILAGIGVLIALSLAWRFYKNNKISPILTDDDINRPFETRLPRAMQIADYQHKQQTIRLKASQAVPI